MAIMTPPQGRPASHYPSWGSETSCWPRSRAASIASHYPSWGSETSRSDDGQSTTYPLITPHGDRKLSLAVSPSAISMNSLPLMGIGNRRRRRGVNADLDLITPHGDRKLQTWGRRVYLRDLLSLPLMGIGNPSYPLILRPRRERSLPLMGIGNFLRKVPRSGSNRSLPLMGIGNPLP